MPVPRQHSLLTDEERLAFAVRELSRVEKRVRLRRMLSPFALAATVFLVGVFVVGTSSTGERQDLMVNLAAGTILACALPAVYYLRLPTQRAIDALQSDIERLSGTSASQEGPTADITRIVAKEQGGRYCVKIRDPHSGRVERAWGDTPREARDVAEARARRRGWEILVEKQ